MEVKITQDEETDECEVFFNGKKVESRAGKLALRGSVESMVVGAYAFCAILIPAHIPLRALGYRGFWRKGRPFFCPQSFDTIPESERKENRWF